MNRRERLFATQRGGAPPPDLVSTHINFQHRPGDRRRKRGELRQLSPEEKMLCALRKVLAQMSHNAGGRARYFTIGDKCRIHARHVSPGAKDGDPGTYRFSGRCQLGVAHATGDSVTKMIEFNISFRDIKDAMGLPDVEYFEPTTVDELPPNTPL